MALLVALVKLAHVFAGFWLVAGLVGRGVTQVKAERTADIGTVKVLIELIGRFDSLMVIPASTAVLAIWPGRGLDRRPADSGLSSGRAHQLAVGRAGSVPEHHGPGPDGVHSPRQRVWRNPR